MPLFKKVNFLLLLTGLIRVHVGQIIHSFCRAVHKFVNVASSPSWWRQVPSSFGWIQTPVAHRKKPSTLRWVLIHDASVWKRLRWPIRRHCGLRMFFSPINLMSHCVQLRTLHTVVGNLQDKKLATGARTCASCGSQLQRSTPLGAIATLLGRYRPPRGSELSVAFLLPACTRFHPGLFL